MNLQEFTESQDASQEVLLVFLHEVHFYLHFELAVQIAAFGRNISYVEAEHIYEIASDQFADFMKSHRLKVLACGRAKSAAAFTPSLFFWKACEA